MSRSDRLEEPLVPVFLRSAHMRVLVVGGGAVAYRKVTGLLGKVASLRVVAPEIQEELARLPGVIATHRAYEAEDLRDIDYLVVATGNEPLAHQIHHDCTAYPRILSCFADFPQLGHFYTPATLEHDGVCLAISTRGTNPSFAAYLRKELAEFLQHRFGS